jgi:uncharacterized membrane protein
MRRVILNIRKLILIASMILASATAHAGSSRSLTMAANDEPAASQPKAAEPATATEAPKYVERPAVVETKADEPKAEPAKPVAEKTASAPKVEKPKRKRYWNEARIINELHRHGVYW